MISVQAARLVKKSLHYLHAAELLLLFSEEDEDYLLDTANYLYLCLETFLLSALKRRGLDIEGVYTITATMETAITLDICTITSWIQRHGREIDQWYSCLEYDCEYTLSKESVEEALREIKYFLEVNNCKWYEPRERT